MNRSNGINPSALRAASARKAASSESFGVWSMDEPIYKCDPLGTVAGMLKRILTILVGMGLGSLIALGLLHLSIMLGWGPRAELNGQADYYRQVMAWVQDNYVDPTAAAPEELTRNALAGLLRGLDPHSDFMRARDYSHLQEDLDSEFGGIGIQVERRNGEVVV